MAEYFATGDATVMDEFLWWEMNKEKFIPVRDLIMEEKIHWVTILFSLGDPVQPEDVTAWHDAFPNEHVIVLADTDLMLHGWLQVGAMPHIGVLDENMQYILYSGQGPTKGMHALMDLGL
jgi:hypothetical protein